VQVNRSLFLRARSVALQWRAAPGGATGYNVYRAATSHGSYQKLTPSPVRDTSYLDAFVDPAQDAFYVVTALDAAGRESNYSGETGVAREVVQ
jgi:fibronectin type 3 domain-containing protein